MTFSGKIRQAAAEGAVLLRNERRTLPFTADDTVAVYGRCQIDYYRSGTGSGGSVHAPYTTSLLDGFSWLREEGAAVPSVDMSLARAYAEWIRDNPFDDGGGGWAAEPWCQKDMELTDGFVASVRERTLKALYVIGRTAGEDKDNRAEEGSYLLTATERSNIETLCRHYEQVVILLNVSGIMDISWIDAPEMGGHITAVLFSWHGGMEGGNAAAQVLCGAVSPSGKLSDTIAKSIDDYPSTRNFGSAEDEVYQEDVYVGYRYFATFAGAAERVMFPFGFGLSYTTFSIEKESCICAKDEITLRAKVRNTGSASGKEVVQVYAQCPQGMLGKPLRSLCAFAKTPLLAPGESCSLTLAFPVRQLASYDDTGATGFAHSYVLEAGTYSLYMGADSLSARRISCDSGGEFTVGRTYALEALSECCAPETQFERFAPRAGADGEFILAYERTPRRTADLRRLIEDTMPGPLERAGGSDVTFSDVRSGRASLDEFIARLSADDLCALVRGEGMMSRKVTAGIAGAFGGLSERLHGLGVPAVGCSDGPSGIRLDNGKEASLVPIGTLLACTWNLPLVRELYAYLGEEMREKEIDLLLGPGVNIHRNPLNGRNFEYFSEDPLLSGRMACAVIQGLAESGSIATVKHLALNNQETHRRTQNSVVSERALREIYLRPFEIAVREGGAMAVMTSYNGINGHWSPSNVQLLRSILRDEWGYDGLVMTDWWAAMNDCVRGGGSTARNLSYMVRARNDLYMVVANDTADKGGFGDDLERSLADGSLAVAELQVCARDILRAVLRTHAAKRPPRPLRNQMAVTAVLKSAPAGVPLHQPGESATPGGAVCFHVPRKGQYALSGFYAKDGDDVSQSVTNVLLNGVSAGSFECRTTNGKWACTTAVQADLEAGYYVVTLEHTKPGIRVRSLTLIEEDTSPVTAGVYR